MTARIRRTSCGDDRRLDRDGFEDADHCHNRIVTRDVPVQLRPLMYAWYMSVESSFAVSKARQQLAAIIDRARAEHAPVYLARRGRRVAAVIDADDLDEILQLAEDMSDIRAAEAARIEMRTTGATPIPWEQVKADLGLL